MVVFMHNMPRSKHNMVEVTAQRMTDTGSWSRFLKSNRVHGFVDLVFSEHDWPKDDDQNVRALPRLADMLSSKADVLRTEM